MEVQSPVIRAVPAADNHIHHIRAGQHYLHSSPEAALKYILAETREPVYYLGPVFRQGEHGSWHQPQFTMLEWYMPGYDMAAIKKQLKELLQAAGMNTPPPEIEDYETSFTRHGGINPFCTDMAAWRKAATEKNINCDTEHWQDARDLILSACVIPKLGHEQPVLLHAFPHQQSLQAELLPGSTDKDDRFELIVNGIEIADGCRELRDQKQLLQRQQKPDPLLLQALKTGLPDCTGVALGVERLLAVMLGEEGIDMVLPWIDGKPP